MNVYPVRLEGDLDPAVSRGLWLVKWLLAIPHYVVLAFLWLAGAILTIVAFFAILFTGRYPRPIFDFVTGVLRWTWRVGFYAYSALGTDRYPPFTLADVPDYPARLTVDYPPQLKRGLVLVKWLLAFPHALVLAVLLGGGPYLSYRAADSGLSFGSGGLIGVLVCIAAVVLLFTGRYPRDLFDLIMGLNRWVYRVAGYVLLLTDEYPPFRFDGGSGSPTDAADRTPPAVARSEQHPAQPSQHEPESTHQWTAGRVVSVVVGSVLVLAGVGMAPAGAAGLWLDQTARDSSGFVSTGLTRFSSPGYAIATEREAVRLEGSDWLIRRSFGEVRITAVSATGKPVFIGIAPEQRATTYLAPMEHTVIHQPARLSSEPASDDLAGQAPPAPPASESFWTKTTSGPDRQTLTWQPTSGDWTVVVMNADGTRVVQADLAVGATLPWLHNASLTLLALAFVFLAGGALLIAIPVRRAHRSMNG